MELRDLSDTTSFLSAVRLVMRENLIKSLKDNSETLSTQDKSDSQESVFSKFRSFHGMPES